MASSTIVEVIYAISKPVPWRDGCLLYLPALLLHWLELEADSGLDLPGPLRTICCRR